MTSRLATLMLVLLVAGCAAGARLPDCHGPWIPINETPRAHGHG